MHEWFTAASYSALKRGHPQVQVLCGIYQNGSLLRLLNHFKLRWVPQSVRDDCFSKAKGTSLRNCHAEPFGALRSLYVGGPYLCLTFGGYLCLHHCLVRYGWWCRSYSCVHLRRCPLRGRLFSAARSMSEGIQFLVLGPEVHDGTWRLLCSSFFS